MEKRPYAVRTFVFIMLSAMFAADIGLRLVTYLNACFSGGLLALCMAVLYDSTWRLWISLVISAAFYIVGRMPKLYVKKESFVRGAVLWLIIGVLVVLDLPVLALTFPGMLLFAVYFIVWQAIGVLAAIQGVYRAYKLR